MSGQPDEADEAFSRAGALAFEKYRVHKDNIRDPGGWLTRLTYHVCMELHRETKKKAAWQIQDPEWVENSPGPPWSIGFANPEWNCIYAEMKAYLHQCIQTLPERMRSAMELLFFEECSHKEIGDRLHISQVAVRKRIQAARTALRYDLGKYLSGKAGPLPSMRPIEAARPVPSQPSPVRPWSRSRPTAAVMVQLRLASGLEKDVTLYLDYQPKHASKRCLAYLQNYIEEHPRGWKKRLELARLLSRMGEITEAITHYRYVVRRQPRQLAPWLELAAIHSNLDRNGQAVRTYQKALRSARLAATKFHLMGLICACRQRWSRARASFTRAAQAEPDNSGHWIVLGMTCLEAGWARAATEALDTALGADQDNALAWILSHDALLDAGRPLEARRRIQRAIELDPSSLPALHRLMDQRSMAGLVQGEEAHNSRDLIRRLERLAPAAVATHRSVALFRLARGEWLKAQQSLAEFVAIHPVNARAWSVLGRILIRVGQEDPAAAALRRALQLDPSDRASRQALCRLLARSGSSAELFPFVDETLKLFPEDPRVIRIAALTLSCHCTDWPRIQELLDRATCLEPSLPATAFCCGTVLANLDRLEEAIDAFESGWSLLPSSDGFHQSSQAAMTLGRCWGIMGVQNLSRKWFRTALQHADFYRAIAPGPAQAMRGAALMALGDYQATALAFRLALDHWLPYPQRDQVESALSCLSQTG